LKSKTLRERADYNTGFQKREPLANASPRPVSKGVISSGGQAIHKTLKPSFRTK
jgi:hypothetical protein